MFLLKTPVAFMSVFPFLILFSPQLDYYELLAVCVIVRLNRWREKEGLMLMHGNYINRIYSALYALLLRRAVGPNYNTIVTN